MQQIKPQLLQEWEKEGEILVVWRCERCYKKIPFYKTNNSFIDMIHLMWAQDHKYCSRCMNKKKDKMIIKIPRIIKILEKYEPKIEDDELLPIVL